MLVLYLCIVPAVILQGHAQERTYPALKVHEFTVAQPATLVAKLTVRCDRCAWDIDGREAAVLSVSLEAGVPSIVPLVRPGRAEYRVLLGSRGTGTYRVRVAQTPHTARDLHDRDAVLVEDITVEQITGRDGYILSLAPQLYARPDTIGRFTDVPLFMWYEEEPSATGTRYRFSVIFSNEDGGTPADRLMATWGRTTDIEYVYSVEVDGNRRILSEDYQGPGHEVLPFRGTRDGTQPQLFVSTENNMVLDEGSPDGRPRYAPAPVPFPLANESREAVMDAHPWLYDVMVRELARERKIVADAPPGKGVIADPRRHVYLEGCGIVGDNALTFSVRVNDVWISSDRGMREYRIVRDGCFRAAVPLPPGAAAVDVGAVRVHAHTRPDRASTVPVRFTRLNTLFGLNEHTAPGPRLLHWSGSEELHAGGPPLELAVK